MRRRVAIVTMALIGYLAITGIATAVMEGPIDIALPPFTKASHGAGNAVTATIAWAPVVFDPGGTPLPNSHTDIIATSPTGAMGEATVAPPAASVPLLLTNGADYSVRVTACQTAGTCDPTSINSFTDTDVTRIDADPPSGTLTLDGGAAFTNSRQVTLGLAATDPLIDGIPGTSSGVTQYAVDQDGDGTFPCSFLVINGQTADTSGCARAMAPTGTATIPAGDGPHTVKVEYGDGARVPTAPCQGIRCHVLILGDPILGNVSAPASATISLDTVLPTAVVQQSRTSVDRGGSVSFDAGGSTDAGTAPSGIDPAGTTWDFADGGPDATGATVSHLYATAGTFVGRLTVRDRAGNVSLPRPFTVTVIGPASAAGGASVGGISGTAGFTVSRLTVRARYTRSRLRGSVSLAGDAATAGRLRAEIRRLNGKLVERISLKALTTGGFTRSVRLPATLLPGRYTLALVGPGGTLRTTLRLTAPRVGVVRAASLRGSSARFAFAAQPVKALRRALSVRWTQGRHLLASVAVRSGRTVRASLPSGTTLRRGTLTATLRAGRVVVASVSRRVR